MAMAEDLPSSSRDPDAFDTLESGGGTPPENDTTPTKKPFFARFRKDKPHSDDERNTNDQSHDENKPPPVKFPQLFRYTTREEKLLMLTACICAAIHGGLLPIFTILFGGIINDFGNVQDTPITPEDIPVERITDEIGSVAKWFLVLGLVAFVTSLVQVRLQLVVAHRVCARLRRKFFESLMSQDYTWIDQNDGGELTARVAGDVNLIQAGMGDKVTSAVQFISMFVIGIIVAFIYGPLLTLVILSVAPLLIISGVAFARLAAESTGEGLGAYGKAGAVASEVIGLIRTVAAYNGQETEAKRYEKELDLAFKADVRKAVISGFGLGFTFLVIFSTYAVAFAFGAWRVREGSMEPGDVLTTFFSVFIACVSIGQAAPSFQAFAVARGAAPRIYEVIERPSEINPLKEDEGETISDFTGHIGFKNVNFNYATRIIDDLQDEATSEFVLNRFNLDVPPGTSHALVGASGCGKSTVVRLVERFYDVQDGEITLDGVNVRQLNVRWLRSQMGYVGQMPTLFMLSIRDNIALGAALDVVMDENTKKTVMRRREVTEEEIIKAAKMANAHDFIMKLPEQYDTMLGERGALLSGGQKQRVCIARALIRNPKILILDESTAALDAQSERVVQEALEKASTGRTTITIAHRLSTVKNCDIISVIDKGTIVESGTHSKLIDREGGAYRTLVEHQKIEARNVEEITRVSATDEGIAEALVYKDSVSKTRHDEARSDSGEEPDDEAAADRGILRRAFVFNIGELHWILFGMMGAAIAGAAFPVMAIVFSEVINVMVDEARNTNEEIRKWCFYFVAIGGGAFVGHFVQLACLGISGEVLTRKLRRLCFRQILKQEMGFFDEKKNSLGALTTRLATEATMVKGVTGDTLGTLTFAFSTVITGFIIAYVACWRIALVVTAVFPLMAISGALQVKLMTGFDADSEKKYADAGAVASEAVDNFDTVTAIGVQDTFMAKYDDALEVPIKNGRKSALVAGIMFGISEFLSQALWAVSFWVGSIFVRSGDCNFVELMKAVTGLLFAGMMLGNVSSQAPDVSKSKISATKIFRLLDRESLIDPVSKGGKQSAISGHIVTENVRFEYPTRPDVPVLRGVSVEVSQGQTLALVGASGCGKSTTIALLERFYDPQSGTIRIDDTEIQVYDLNHMRLHLGLVSQEPDLFNRSIRDNIAYGLDHSDGTPVTDEMIIEAAKAANAHSFISDLNDGYETIVGPRGNRLSGGQRQRVAIARSLVRKPRILLLDEATSALDAVSERVVQDALDKASAGRTTVAIAHRLSTVKDANVIAVFSRGRIVESGTHAQLLRIPNGEYANLVKNQLTEAPDQSQ